MRAGYMGSCAHYAGEVTLLDRWVGRLFQKIEDLGLLENTAVIFTSDYGFYHGEHGLMVKSIITEKYQGLAPLYNEVTHIPLMMHLPKIKPQRNGCLSVTLSSPL